MNMIYLPFLLLNFAENAAVDTFWSLIGAWLELFDAIRQMLKILILKL